MIAAVRVRLPRERLREAMRRQVRAAAAVRVDEETGEPDAEWPGGERDETPQRLTKS